MALNLKSLKSTWYIFYHQFFLIVSIKIQKSRKCSRYFKQNKVSNDHQGKPIQRCRSNGRKQLLLEERYPCILPPSLPPFLPFIFHSRFPLAELNFKSADRRAWKTVCRSQSSMILSRTGEGWAGDWKQMTGALNKPGLITSLGLRASWKSKVLVVRYYWQSSVTEIMHVKPLVQYKGWNKSSLHQPPPPHHYLSLSLLLNGKRFPGGSDGKEPPEIQTWIWSLDWEDPLEKGMATHSSILAWRNPWTEGPHGLYSSWGGKQLDIIEWLTLLLYRIIKETGEFAKGC